MKNISAEKAYEILQKRDQVFLDVRTLQEYDKGHIQNAINIPLNFLKDIIQKVIRNKNEPLYVYCLSGSRSTQAAKILEGLGYTNVFNLESGLLVWRAKNLPLIT